MCNNLSSNYNKIKSLLTVTACGTAAFIGYSIHECHDNVYNSIVMPMVKLLDPELSHKIAIIALKYGLVSPRKTEDFPKLHTKLLGIDFSNPLGIAAGFDKQAEAVKGLHKLGFGFVEIGSVTPLPQPGNPKPRVFRLTEDNAVINRYGFNSDGHELVYERLKKIKSDTSFNGIVGVNLGKNKLSEDPIKDYVDGIIKFSDVADYFVINVSSPNTPGLRNLQNKENLEELLHHVNNARNNTKCQSPLFLKLAPDLTEQEQKDIAKVLLKEKSTVDGLILSNTTLSRPSLKNKNKSESGGLSGAPLTKLSTELIANMYQFTKGQIPIIGVGGIFNGDDAYKKIKSGASLIQIYTSYINEGPPIVNKIKKELNELLEKDGYSSVFNAVGKDVRFSQSK